MSPRPSGRELGGSFEGVHTKTTAGLGFLQWLTLIGGDALSAYTISGATQGDLELKAPNPKDDEDVAGIINRIQFRPTKPDHLTSCPRRLEGYVDVVHPVLKFTNVDGKPSTADVMTKCGELKTKVQNVIASFRGGAFVGGTGT